MFEVFLVQRFRNNLFSQGLYILKSCNFALVKALTNKNINFITRLASEITLQAIVKKSV